MLVFDDSIDNLENTRKFWIKNTISTVKTKKLTSKNDTNLENKIIKNQKLNKKSNYDISSRKKTIKNCDNDKNRNFNKNNTNYSKDNNRDRIKYDFLSKKNLNKLSYNDKSQYQNGKKQTKKTKKIRGFN